MVELRRTVRFCINPPGTSTPPHGSAVNGFGGVPAMSGLGRYYEIDLSCTGEPDPRTGYLVNIKDIDRAARAAVIPIIEKACGDSPTVQPASIMPTLWRAAAHALPAPLTRLRWRLTPTYSVEMTTASAQRVVMRQRFDFAAAHRLHTPALSEEANRATFGRCNNPSGHGHNYAVEPAVSFDPQAPNPLTLHQLERITHDAVIDPFDHKHLNKDTPEFAELGGLNPSVENIARVFHARLTAAFAQHAPGARVESVTVWETDRTSGTFPA